MPSSNDDKTAGAQVTGNVEHVSKCPLEAGYNRGAEAGEKGDMDNVNEANDQYTANESETKTHEHDDKQDDGDHNCEDSVISLTDEQKEASEGCFKRFCAAFMEEIVQLKWRVFILICLFRLGVYYIHDFPGSMGMGKTGSIEARFYEHGKEYTYTMNQALYTVYSLPNIVLGLIGGILIDYVLGIRTSMMIFCGLVTLGSFIFFLGVQFIYYEVMMTGWFIVSLGGETIALAQHVLIMRWFRGGRGVAFAYATTVALLRAAASANFFFTPLISLNYGVTYAALTGTFVCVFSFISAIPLVFADRYAEKRSIINVQNTHEPVIDEQTGERVKVTFKDRVKIIFLSVRTLPPQIWILSSVCVFMYCSDLPFVGFGKNFFKVKYDIPPEDAARPMSFYQLTSAISCPLAGIICDLTGRNVYILTITSVCFVLIHVIMIVTYIPPAAAMIIFGIFYSFLVSGLWPAIIFIVSPRVIAISYALVNTIQAIGLAITPLIIGRILDANLDDSKPKPRPVTLTGYYYTEGLLITFAVISLISSIILGIIDKRMSGGILSVGGKKRSHIMRLRMQHPDKDMDCNEFHRATADVQQYTHDTV